MSIVAILFSQPLHSHPSSLSLPTSQKEPLLSVATHSSSLQGAI